MIDLPLQPLAGADLAVQSLLGTPVRLYPWGVVVDKATVYPYATWRTVAGSGQAYLHGRSDADRVTVQIDVWARQPDVARACARALRNALELHCYVVALHGDSKDPDTGAYRYGFDCDWIVPRDTAAID